MTANEFARPIRLDALGPGARDFAFAAEPEERAALARRFAVEAIDRLEVQAALHRDGPVVRAEGRVIAAVVQRCVATDAPLPIAIDETFALRFVPAADVGDDEVELSEADCDTVAYADGAVDLGEAAAETLLLALDPFPRSPGADAALREAGVLEEGETGPFAALKGLRDRLSG